MFDACYWILDAGCSILDMRFTTIQMADVYFRSKFSTSVSNIEYPGSRSKHLQNAWLRRFATSGSQRKDAYHCDDHGDTKEGQYLIVSFQGIDRF
jgi:hypothetical protein